MVISIDLDKIKWIFIYDYTCVREGSGTPLQYSCLENPVDGGAWKAAVHGVAESRTRLNNFTFTFHFHPLEKEMATHSSVLARRIPGMREPGGLPSMGSYRVRHDWNDLAATAYLCSPHSNKEIEHFYNFIKFTYAPYYSIPTPYRLPCHNQFLLS